MKTQFMQMAEDEARRSAQNFRHGAVVVRGGKLLSSGHNKVTTKCPSHMFSIHAEMAAIKHSTERCGLVDAHVYVARVNRCGHTAESKPCKMCQRFMRMHGISRVYYSTNESNVVNSMYIR